METRALGPPAIGEPEIAAWDLATALGKDPAGLDPAVAEAGFATMSAALTPERRGSSFAPEQDAPQDADAYQRLASFAGRTVR